MSAAVYRLYGDRRSGSATVELALAEIGAACKCLEVPLERHAQRSADYEQVNAQRKLPTLVTPDGEVLTESAAILLLLAERHPEARLMPDGADRAQAMRWLLFIATEIYPLVEIIDYPERFMVDADTASDQQREALRNVVRETWKRRWLLVEEAASGTPWFFPSGFSLVDIYCAVISRWAQQGEWRAQALPRIEAIASAIGRRERCAPVWTRHFG